MTQLATAIRIAPLFFAAVFVAFVPDSRGDFLIYHPPGGGTWILQGTVSGHGPISYRHPALKQDIHFGVGMLRSGQIEYMKARSTRQEYQRLLREAGKDSDAVFKVAVWALKKGMLPDFYDAVKRSLEYDRKNDLALRIMELKKQIEKPLADDGGAMEKSLRSSRPWSRMRVETSNHYIMLTDTPRERMVKIFRRTVSA